MLKPCADLIEQLIRHDQGTGFTYGNEPRFEMREKPLLDHFSSSFLPDNQNRSEGRSCGSLLLSWSKTFQVPGQVHEKNRTSTHPQSACGSLTTDQRLS